MNTLACPMSNALLSTRVPALEQKRIDEQWSFVLLSNYAENQDNSSYERNLELLQQGACRSRAWEPEDCGTILRDTVLQELPRLLVHSCSVEQLVPPVVDILIAKYGAQSKTAVTYLFPETYFKTLLHPSVKRKIGGIMQHDESAWYSAFLDFSWEQPAIPLPTDQSATQNMSMCLLSR